MNNDLMKFELEPDNRNATDEDLVNDLIKVAQEPKQRTVLRSDYNKIGRFHSSTLERRLGGWNGALSRARLEITIHRNVTEEDLLQDMRRVARSLRKVTVGYDEYGTHGIYSCGAITTRFDTWNKALSIAGLEIQRTTNNPEEDLLENIEAVWRTMGRQPRRHQMDEEPSRFSSSTYSKRFGSWRNALRVFVDSVNADSDETWKQPDRTIEKSDQEEPGVERIQKPFRHKTKRQPNWRVRFLVLRRDNFKCVSCGRSPANMAGVVLEVDHIVAWTSGGETILENLQSLCQECNGGKSNLEYEEPSAV